MMAIGDALAVIKEALESISGTIINGIINFVSLVSGGAINIPPFVVQLILIALVLLSFWKWAKRLPLIILVLLGLFLMAFLVDLFSL